MQRGRVDRLRVGKENEWGKNHTHRKETGDTEKLVLIDHI